MFIANGITKLYPTETVGLYLDKCDITDPCSEEYLFRAIAKGNSYKKLRKNNKALSYTRAREIPLAALKEIGLDTTLFGTQGLRSGGATEAANAGVPDRLFKKRGRSRSDSAKDGYVKDNIQQLLT